MNILKKSSLVASILLLSVIGFFFYLSSEKKLIMPKNSQIISKTVKAPNNNAQEISPSTIIVPDLEKSISKISVPENKEDSSQTPIKLTSENFQYLYRVCLEKPCDAPDDPWKVYQYLKRTKNRRANESLIIYISMKKLIYPEFRDQYKDVVKRMIEDFYPIEDKPDAMAEYYRNIGENLKALKIYLELEEKFKYDMSKNLIPKLQIGNIYYDLNRFAEALPYYQAAYDITLYDKKNDDIQVQSMDYIIGRINDINKRLNEASR